MNESREVLQHSPFVPPDPTLRHYSVLFGYANPSQYTGWKDEVLSWKKTAYLHGGLNPTTTYRLKGPDALKLLSDHCVNGFTKFTVGSARHAVMCNDDGLIMAHGVLVRSGEDEFMTYWLMPWIDFIVDKGGYDVVGEDLTGSVFLFQIAGPRSLEILEAATGEDLRDIGFLRQRTTAVCGTDVRVSSSVDVLRIGMAGSLAYELHGPLDQAHAVYEAVMRAGEPFGLRRLGRSQYEMNHTENGFPQGHMHFLYPWFEDPELAEHLSGAGMGVGGAPQLTGSAGTDMRLRYRTPYEVGWGHIVKFNHDFVGRAALEAEAASPQRTMVTLVWNPDDVLETFRSHFEPGDELQYMNFTQEHDVKVAGSFASDLVTKDGAAIGVSSGRIYSYYYRQMISLCTIDVAQAHIGTTVEVLWGNPGTRQFAIRATVERFPYFDEGRNETVDVTTPQGSDAA